MHMCGHLPVPPHQLFPSGGLVDLQTSWAAVIRGPIFFWLQSTSDSDDGRRHSSNRRLDLGVEFCLDGAGVNLDDKRKSGFEIFRIKNALCLPPTCDRVNGNQGCGGQDRTRHRLAGRSAAIRRRGGSGRTSSHPALRSLSLVGLFGNFADALDEGAGCLVRPVQLEAQIMRGIAVLSIRAPVRTDWGT